MKQNGKRAYIRDILNDYPHIYAKPHEQRTENEQRRIAIVNSVLEVVEHMPDARSKRKFIDMVYFKKSHTLQGAALNIPIGYRTAIRWNAHIIELMGEEMQLP